MALLKENKLDRGFRVFRNPVMDALSRAHPAIPAVMWLPVAVFSLGLAVYFGLAWYHFLWTLPAGVLLWSLSEYWLHRSFFHWRPNNRLLARMQYWVHEHHHRYQEWDRLVAPPLMSLPIFFFFLGIFWFAFGGTLEAMPHPAIYPLLSGFILGYLAYDYTHFATHFWPCRSKWMKNRRKLHFQHHFAFPDRWYGISMPLWDYIFRTHVKKGEKSRNTTASREELEAQPKHAMDAYAEYVAQLVEQYAAEDARKEEAQQAVEIAAETPISGRLPEVAANGAGEGAAAARASVNGGNETDVPAPSEKAGDAAHEPAGAAREETSSASG